jgi:hypothetical protein
MIKANRNHIGLITAQHLVRGTQVLKVEANMGYPTEVEDNDAAALRRINNASPIQPISRPHSFGTANVCSLRVHSTKGEAQSTSSSCKPCVLRTALMYSITRLLLS